MQTSLDVALISMPFAPLNLASIGLALLKAALDKDGVSSEIFYFTIRYGELIGAPAYTNICNETHPHDLVGEWIFSRSLFDEKPSPEADPYIDDILRGRAGRRPNSSNYLKPPSESLIKEIIGACGKVEEFLDDCLATIIARRPRVVGFTSVFLQQVASLALARRIKRRCPDTFIVFGGANCEAVMGREMIRQFPFVDAVVSGEGDLAFPEIVRRVLARQPISGLQGVFCRSARSLAILNEPLRNTPTVGDLDLLPTPDYTDYFRQLGRSTLDIDDRVYVLFETSRGCWWGEKHHCTFCGLNGETMNHRSKTGEKALKELTEIVGKYPGRPVRVVDNILDMAYFKDFLPALAERGLGVNLFYEVKANLKKSQLRLLRDAGVSVIQPGIESLSDQVLRIMRKGVKALQNIQLLKWCKELNLIPDWNLLWGFPGESAQEYRRLAGLVPLLTHLQPPVAALTIRVDRFSPNFFEAEKLGFKNLLPYPAYSYVYPLPAEAVNNLAYFFTFEYSSHPDVSSYVGPLADEVAKWQAVHADSALFWVEKAGQLLIWDSRPVSAQPLSVLTGREKFIYLACDQVTTPDQVLRMWQAHMDEPLTLEEIIRDLEVFITKKLMIKEGESYLSLAIPRSLVTGDSATVERADEKVLITL